MDELCFSSKDFLLFFFILSLSLSLFFSFSPCCLLEWVYWEYRRFCRDLLCGRELCVGGGVVNGCEADGFA